MKIIDVSKPTCSIVKVGHTGENVFETVQIDVSAWASAYPEATFNLIFKRADGEIYPLISGATESPLVWQPSSVDTAVEGISYLEAQVMLGSMLGKSEICAVSIKKSLAAAGSVPSAVPSWVDVTIATVEAAKDAAEAAVEHYPRIVDGYWYVWDVENEQWANTNVKATGDIDEQAISEAVEDYLDEHPIAVTVDSALSGTSENPVQNKVINAALQSKGTYSKPSGGIPASDLAPGVIPVVPQMATQTNMSDWTSGKTVDAAVLKTGFQSAKQTLLQALGSIDNDVASLQANKADRSEVPTKTSDLTNDSGFQTATQVQGAIAAIPDELPAITAADNGKFLRVVSGAWAAQTVPAAESNSFGGGS